MWEKRAPNVCAIFKSRDPVFWAVELARIELGRKISSLRRSLDPNVRSLEAIPAFDIALAHELYKLLLAPGGNVWKSAKKLLVVSDGPLGQLPFQLLVTRELPSSEKEGRLL